MCVQPILLPMLYTLDYNLYGYWHVEPKQMLSKNGDDSWCYPEVKYLRCELHFPRNRIRHLHSGAAEAFRRAKNFQNKLRKFQCNFKWHKTQYWNIPITQQLTKLLYDETGHVFQIYSGKLLTNWIYFGTRNFTEFC